MDCEADQPGAYIWCWSVQIVSFWLTNCNHQSQNETVIHPISIKKNREDLACRKNLRPVTDETCGLTYPQTRKMFKPIVPMSIPSEWMAVCSLLIERFWAWVSKELW